jgi:toxin ParE1/3/4
VARLRLTPRAESDLRAIWTTIARHDEAAADRLILRLFEVMELAASMPQMGPPRADLSPTARLLIEAPYLVIYEPQPDGILAVAVVHGARDPADWLD